jgi:tryptophan 7-halogenase
MKNAPLKSYVIVGGGTSGWIMAAVLSRVFEGSNIDITLVESPTIGTIGVGEATVPSFIDLLTFLDVPGKDFIEKTNATFKLGIKFKDWQKPGESYWHPFGFIGSNPDGLDFFQHWLKTYLNSDQPHAYTDFAPSAAIGEEQRFFIPDPNNLNNLQKMGYALHFDAGLAAKYLTEYATAKGVKHIQAHINDVALDENGNIQSVILEDKKEVSGEFFIDCTGQYGLLIEKALKVNYLNWQHYLPVDSAVVMQSENVEDFPPYTQATAHEHGWRWRIPLRNRTGNGYVFCSEYCDDDTAKKLLLENIKGKPITEPRIIRFKTGMREKSWHKNCVAIGLSSGFLEPLESTGIYLIMRGALSFAQMLPDLSLNQATQNEYNRLMSIEYESLRDFIIMHYCTSKRSDTGFWRSWQTRDIPDSLKAKLSLYQSQGRLVRNEIDLFGPDSWHAVLTGMGVIPEGYDPAVDAADYESLKSTMSKIEKSLQHSVKELLTHKEYVDRLLKN